MSKKTTILKRFAIEGDTPFDIADELNMDEEEVLDVLRKALQRNVAKLRVAAPPPTPKPETPK